MDFSNREIASYVWLALFLGWSLRSPSVRSSFRALVRTFCQMAILVPIGLAAVYIAVCVYGLALLGIWTIVSLKTTILWSITFAFATMLDLNRITEDRTFFARTVRETLAITVILTFVVEFHSFSLPVELIAVPLLTLLGMLHAVAGTRPEFLKVESVLGYLLSMMGIGFLGYSAYLTVYVIESFASVETFQEFCIPIILSLIFLPFLYVLMLYAVYERAFSSLRWAIGDAALRQSAKWRALFTFRHDLEALDRWVRSIGRSHPTDRATLLLSFAEARKIAEREANPPSVSASQGWSPYIAKNFLVNHGLSTRDYHQSSDNEWFAGSNCLEIDESILPNNIAYYLSGNENAVTELKLKMNVNDPVNLDTAERRFQAIAGALLTTALGGETAAPIVVRLAGRKDFESAIAQGRVKLFKDVWSVGIRGGYSRTLAIRRDEA